jgi:hypothetical protein
VVSNTMRQEVKVGFNNFQWANQGLPEVGDTFQYSFPGLTLGKPYNYPQWLYQNNIESRYDLSWHKSKHDIKMGGEFIYAHITALWFLQQQGIMTFTSVPADITTRIPQNQPRCVEVESRLDPHVQRSSGTTTAATGRRRPRPHLVGLAGRHLALEQSAHAQLRHPLG